MLHLDWMLTEFLSSKIGMGGKSEWAEFLPEKMELGGISHILDNTCVFFLLPFYDLNSLLDSDA